MQELVWTKVCHVIGEAFPVLEGLDPEALLDLQRDVVDDLWACSFQEMIERIGNQPRAQDPHQALSEETNRERDALSPISRATLEPTKSNSEAE